MSILNPDIAAIFDVKERYLRMPPAEKKQLYKVKEPKCLLALDTWTDHLEKQKVRLKALRDEFLEERNIPRINNYKPDNGINSKISLWEGNLENLEVDAIVNIADPSLLTGGKNFKAIHDAAGSELIEECKIVGGVKPTQARITGGYLLPAKYIIHMVPPPDEQIVQESLEASYNSCLDVFTKQNLKSIAFPNIGPKNKLTEEETTLLALKVVRKFLEARTRRINRIVFCLDSNEMILYESLAQLLFPPAK